MRHFIFRDFDDALHSLVSFVKASHPNQITDPFEVPVADRGERRGIRDRVETFTLCRVKRELPKKIPLKTFVISTSTYVLCL